MRCRLWLSLVVGVLVLIGSPIAQTPGQHDDGDRVPFLDDYVGQYELTPNFILNVMRVGDALYVQGPRQSATQMHAQTQTEYVVAASRLRIIFGVNLISREVDHLIFEQDGVGRRAEKVFEIVANAEAHAREIAPDTLERYEGTYEGRPGFTITISLEDGRLWTGMEGQPRRTLLPTSETDFLYENSSARLSFEVGTAGKVEGLILHQGGGSECLDRMLFWSALDLEKKLSEFQDFCNAHRAHASLQGRTPVQTRKDVAALHHYRWEVHCRGLYQTPIAA